MRSRCLPYTLVANVHVHVHAQLEDKQHTAPHPQGGLSFGKISELTVFGAAERQTCFESEAAW